MDDPGLSLSRIDELIAERTTMLEKLRQAEHSTEVELRQLDTTRQVLLRYSANDGTASTDQSTETVGEPADAIESTEPASGESVRRIRSTQLVAELVREVGRPLTRDRIVEEFRDRGLIPPSWTNPRNAINNALSRAKQRGELRFDEQTGEYSAP